MWTPLSEIARVSPESPWRLEISTLKNLSTLKNTKESKKMSKSQRNIYDSKDSLNQEEDIKIEVEEDDSMEIERPGEYSNDSEDSEDYEDPEDSENELEEELKKSMMTKVKEIAKLGKDNIGHFVKNGGIAAMEISSNPYVKALGSGCHLIGEFISSANNDSKTSEECMNLLKHLTTDVNERDKRCQQKEETVFQRELHVAEREKNVGEILSFLYEREKAVGEREKNVGIQQKEILQKITEFKTTKDNFYGKRERTDTEDEDEEVPPQAKGYDGAKRIKCDCGSEIRKSDMARHRGTLKHQDYTEKM